MQRRPFLIFTAILAGGGAVIGALAAGLPASRAAPAIALLEPDEAEAALVRATRASRQAESRAASFTAQAEAASEAATRSAREAAALAAKIQQAEADIAIARARLTIARSQRAEVSARLAAKRAPTARLAAALQTAARRPLALSALQPGSLEDVVHVRAVMSSAVPQIAQRTASLKRDLDRGRALEAQTARAITQLQDGESALRQRRTELAAIEQRQRVASRSARGSALREAERALALAEEARDLDGLIETLDDIAALRSDLAALPGPVLRPPDLLTQPTSGEAATPDPAPAPLPTGLASAPGPRDWQLPAQGRIVLGFGARRTSGLPSTGLTLAPPVDAQVVAPARGRVAFAGPYRGFARIVIIEHDGGWTSLVTGLAQVDVGVGDQVIGGSPLGRASGGAQPLTIELRQRGTPINPLQYMR